jgi:hypothetical protein
MRYCCMMEMRRMHFRTRYYCQIVLVIIVTALSIEFVTLRVELVATSVRICIWYSIPLHCSSVGAWVVSRPS